MSSEPVWEDPPTRAGQLRVLDPRWETMKEHPGKWLLWTSNAATASLNRFKVKGYEATTRKNADGTYCIYTRWPS